MNKQFLGLGLLVAMGANATDQITTVQTTMKIGYVSASAILNESKLGKQLKKELDQKYESIARELQSDEQMIVKATNELQAKKTTLSEAAFEKAQNEVKDMARKYQAKRPEKEDEFKTFELKANERIIKEILEVAATIGQQDSYDALIDRESGRVLWTASRNDCTNKLLAGLDKKFDQTATKVATTATAKKSA